jgi:hypothetical protein
MPVGFSSYPPLIGIHWFHETSSIRDSLVKEPVLTFALLFIVGPIISLILSEKLQNAM